MVPVVLLVEGQGERGECAAQQRVILPPCGQRVEEQLAHQQNALLDLGLPVVGGVRGQQLLEVDELFAVLVLLEQAGQHQLHVGAVCRLVDVVHVDRVARGVVGARPAAVLHVDVEVEIHDGAVGGERRLVGQEDHGLVWLSHRPGSIVPKLAVLRFTLTCPRRLV